MNLSRVVPIVVVAIVPLALGVWWLATREATSPDQPEPPSESSADDPWKHIQKSIFPRGQIETVHTTDQFTFLYVRSTDADRWLATPPGEFAVGDVIQFEVAPRAVKQDFKSKSLGRVFPSIVLVGNGGVKVIQPATSKPPSA